MYENDVLVFSDEIHCDLVLPNYKHLPFASISQEFEQHCITAHAASKTFNLAGLATSSVIIANEQLRKQYTDFYTALKLTSAISLAKLQPRQPWKKEKNGFNNFCIMSMTT